MQEYVSSLTDSLFGALQGKCEGDVKPALPSFTYKNVPFDSDKWDREVKMKAQTDAYEKYVVTYKSPDKLLALHLTYTIYTDFPVVEWLPEFEAITGADTGIIENFRSLNLDIPFTDDHDWKNYPRRTVTLRRNLGSKNRVDDFAARNVVMTNRYPLNHVVMDTDEGRSSAAWLPFFGVDFDEDYGFNVAIGWSGAWSAELDLSYNGLKVNAGMLHTRFRLHPDEIIRQPSIFIMMRDGFSVRDCQNLHRQFMLAFHSPHGKDGKLVKPPLAAAVWGGKPNDVVLKCLDEMERRGVKYDVLWMDAGWYGKDRPVADDEFKGSDWARTVGDWRVNQVPHPGGLSPIAKRAHKMGMKYMLWVEMERVVEDVPVAKEHPDWILMNPDNPNAGRMLDIGREEVREWALENVRRLVEEEGIDYYREDFNFNTIPYWKGADEADRQGICEAKFVAGLYEFWDELRKRFPNMMIDNCASGGRRIDFETASRSIAMFRSDIIGRPFYDSGPAQQVELHYLADWVPLFGGSFAVVDGDDYGCLTAVSYGISFGCGYDPSKLDAAWEKRITTLMKRMQGYFVYDFYPLMSDPEDWNKIASYQFHNPEKDTGMVAAFRHRNGNEASIEVVLNQINTRAKYIVEDEKGDIREMRGSELQRFTIAFNDEYQAHVLFYSRKNAK